MSMQLTADLQTLEISPSSCTGFEDEELGACIGLVGWGFPSQSMARQGWYQAVQTAAFNTSGGLKASSTNKSFFYTALLHRQRSAFGPFGFQDVDWSKFDVASFPWALPDQIFEKLYPDVMADRGQTYERPDNLG